MSLFSLQGYFRIADRDANGNIGKLRWVGNVPEATLSLNSESTDKNESYSGQRLQIGRLVTATTASLNMTLDEWSSANLALAFQGAVNNITSGSVTGETFPTGLVAGDQVRLAHSFVTGLALTDSAASPATVDPGDYRLVGHAGATVEIVDPTGYTQPFKAAYTYPAVNNIVMFSQPGAEVFVQFDGLNTETGKPVLIELWRVRFNPVSELGLINAEYGSLSMSAAVLFDPGRAPDPALGGFGRLLERVV